MPTQLKTLERDVSEQAAGLLLGLDGHLAFSVHDPSDDEELQTLLQGKGIRPFQVAVGGEGRDRRQADLLGHEHRLQGQARGDPAAGPAPRAWPLWSTSW